MNNFKKLIVGNYCNREQAISNPSLWPMMNIKIWVTGDNTFESKSWYNYRGEENSYNWLRYTIVESTENLVRTEIFSVTKDKETCPFVWTWDWNTGWWVGTTGDDCVVRNVKLTSTIRFNGYQYRSIDTGIDLETNKLKWGKYAEDGEFAFVEI